jgi:Ni,Fe-hydrogenase I cytochrome b subunit
VLKKTHGEKRNKAVFKHGTFPDINIVIFLEEVMSQNFTEEPKLSISVTYFLLMLFGMILGVAGYRILNDAEDSAWPVALGGILSIALPLGFGVIKNGKVSFAIQEFVASSSKLGQGGYKSNLIALFFWCLLVLIALGFAIYQEI